MSIPDESAVAYSGNALFDLFMILIWINDMLTKISDKVQGARHKITRLKIQGSRCEVQV